MKALDEAAEKRRRENHWNMAIDRLKKAARAARFLGDEDVEFRILQLKEMCSIKMREER